MVSLHGGGTTAPFTGRPRGQRGGWQSAGLGVDILTMARLVCGAGRQREVRGEVKLHIGALAGGKFSTGSLRPVGLAAAAAGLTAALSALSHTSPSPPTVAVTTGRFRPVSEEATRSTPGVVVVAAPCIVWVRKVEEGIGVESITYIRRTEGSCQIHGGFSL